MCSSLEMMLLVQIFEANFVTPCADVSAKGLWFVVREKKERGLSIHVGGSRGGTSTFLHQAMKKCEEQHS